MDLSLVKKVVELCDSGDVNRYISHGWTLLEICKRRDGFPQCPAQSPLYIVGWISETEAPIDPPSKYEISDSDLMFSL